MQESFTARESGAYTEGPIHTRWDTLALMNLLLSFQGRLAITALQRAFLSHYLTDPAAPPATIDAAPFQ